jgi:hypothetical protein
MNTNEREWGQGFMALAKSQRTRRKPSPPTRRIQRHHLHAVHPVAQFGRVNCNGSREDAKDAKKTTATTRRILRHALHPVHAVAKFTRHFDDNYGEKGNRECTRRNANGVNDLGLSRRRKGRGGNNCHQHADFNDTQARNSATPSARGAPCRTIQPGKLQWLLRRRKEREENHRHRLAEFSDTLCTRCALSHNSIREINDTQAAKLACSPADKEHHSPYPLRLGLAPHW